MGKLFLRPLGQLLIAAMLLGISLSAHAQEVIPDFYRDPGVYPNRSYVNQSLNEHIDPFTGALQHHYVDISLPGNGGFNLNVVRSYNSSSVDPVSPITFDFLAGSGWTIHFGRVLSKNTSICSYGTPVLELPDGSRQLFTFTDNMTPLMLTTQRWRADCNTSVGTLGLTVYSPDGTRYDMTHAATVGASPQLSYAWYTTKITDRNGNYATINYASAYSPEITSISTNDGRLLNFSYADSGQMNRRISQISGAGQTYLYAYQTIGLSATYFLTSVTRPDGTRWSYSYNGNLSPSPSAGSYAMKTATYPQGGVISYGYGYANFGVVGDFANRSTVVTSKSLSTGGNWTFSYVPGSFNINDTTTVTTPSGTETYRHVGANTIGYMGPVWMVGLIMSKAIGDLQTEVYTWDKQKLSSQDNFRPGAFGTKVDLGATNAPIMTQKQITRDGATYTTSYSNFDGYGNPRMVTESGTSGGNRTATVTYFTDASKWIVNKVQNESFNGSSVTRSFDGNGNLLSITTDQVTTGYGYDSQGNVQYVTYPRGLTHSYSSYMRGVAQSESQPEGISISRIVSDAGNVTSETNGEYRTTTYGYDGLNRVTSIGYPAGNNVSVAYGANFKSATRGGLNETTNYDDFGRPNSVTLGGITRSYNSDALGRKTFESNPGSGVGTTYQYDILDRVTKVSNADGTFNITSFGVGTKTVTDERNKSTTYSYRAYGNPEQRFLMNISAADSSANVSLLRNNKDLITSATQAGLTRGYDYDGRYYLTSVTNPETGTTSYGRDAAGNMTSRSVGSSGTTSYGYDGKNRLTSVIYPGTTPSVTQNYTKTGKLSTVTSSVASRSYSYDANDNLTSESATVDGITFNTGYGYNGLDQLSSITYPNSGRIVGYAPDVLGRPTQVSGYISNVSYWPSGQVSQINYVNGTVTNYNQNSRLWPSSFSTQKSGVMYVNSNYSYDGVGNLTSIGDSSDSSYVRSLLGYDNINRLTNVNGPWGVGTIAYSGASNISSQVFGSTSLSYGYDGSNRLTSVSGIRATSYGYDAYGNISSGSGNVYTYDGVPNLQCVNCSDAANKIEYSYDGVNKRATVKKSGIKTYEVYGSHGNQLIEYTPNQFNRLVEYIYLGGKRVAQRRSADTATSTTVLTVTSPPAIVNSPITLIATVTGNSPSGTVTFKDGATTLGTSSMDVSGQTALSATFSTTGSHSLTAIYAGDTNNTASTSSAVNLAVITPSTITLSATPNPVGANQPVTLNATVTGSSPSGTVTFNDGVATLGTAYLNGAGQASLTASFASAVNHLLSVSYIGDANNAASTSPGVTLVVQIQSTTTLMATPNPVGANQLVTLNATVTGSNPGGSVTFKEGVTTLGTASLNGAGQAAFITTFSSLGDHYLTAVYGGDANNIASTSLSSILTVITQSTTALSVAPNPANVNQQITLNASVTGSSPSGSVVFKDGTTTLGTTNLNGAGQASIATSFASAVNHSLTVVYVGDTSNTPSTSPAVTLVVQIQSTTTLTAAPNPSGANQAVTLNASVTGSSPTGSVTFKDGATTLGTANVYGTGQAGFVTTFASLGNHDLTAVYGGNENNITSTSPIVALKVLVACTLTATPSAITPGGSSTLTSSCSPSATSFVWTGGTCAGTTAASCTVTPLATTTYTVAGVSPEGTGIAASTTVTVFTLHLTNASTRGLVQTGAGVMIGGFIISGSTPKAVLIRARGPSMSAIGVTSVLANPMLQLYSGSTAIASNDNWGTATNAAAIAATGLAPTNSLESAILTTLSPGAYTAIVSGVGGTNGIGIVEVIEIDHPESPLSNFSTRAQVQTGANVMIGGFVVSGSSAATVLVRARGPSLAAFGVTGVLANPVLQLYSGSTVIASNDDWGTATNAAAIVATGLAPTNSLESAILITLQPGAYTAIVNGAGGGSGIGIVEVLAQ